MKIFFKKFIEYILIVLTVLFLIIKPSLPQYGERISMLFFGTLAFYYLASGVIVFLDKYRITRIVRLIYLIGLWGVAMTVIGIMARILLIHMNKDLLVICISSLTAILFFIRIVFTRLKKEENKKIFGYQMQPLVIRSILAISLGVAFILTDTYTVYSLFGTYRNDKMYVEKIIYVYQNPKDSLAVSDFKKYDSILRNQKLRGKK